MRLDLWKWLLTWEGRVQRLPYFLAGAILGAIKFVIDRTVAAHFGETWQVSNYVFPSLHFTVFDDGRGHGELYILLWAIAIPFFWVGIALTLRRLRDAGKSAAWVFLFFFPLANLAMFLWLSLISSAPATGVTDTEGEISGKAGQFRKAAMGVGIAVPLGIALIAFGTGALKEYSYGLFLGVPFLTGFVSSWFLNVGNIQSKFDTIKINTATVFLLGFGLVGFRYEGVLCILMVLPLALPFALAGGLTARSTLQHRMRTSTPPTFAAWLAVLPLMMLGEQAAKLEPPVLSVTTSITIDAPVSTVWKNVLAFPPLAPPEEWIFQAGIAYPTSAKIIGSGPGAIRYCKFSTGDFVEPITVWDKDRLLAFNVTAQPQALRELSPWKITPPHLEQNYMRSRHGQFRLVALPGNRTLLEGTTWYQNYFWPQPYWRLWSDSIVHKIHLRVLQHVKQQAEARDEVDRFFPKREF
jgi:uncharacterized membrane protein YhaH (DUF805 family)